MFNFVSHSGPLPLPFSTVRASPSLHLLFADLLSLSDFLKQGLQYFLNSITTGRRLDIQVDLRRTLAIHRDSWSKSTLFRVCS